MEKKNIFIKKLKMIFIVCLAVMVVGCVSRTSKQMTANFGGSAKAISLQTATTLKKVRISDSDYLVSSELNNKGAALQLPAISPEDITLRLTLLNEIFKYSEALSIMSSNTEPNKIDKASRQLYSSIGALNQTLEQTTKRATPLLTDNDLKLIATTVNITGRWFFERARLKAIKTTVIKADPVISKAIELLTTEIKKDGPWSKSLQLSSTSEAKNLFRAAQTIKNVPEKRKLLAEAQQLYDQASFENSTFAQLNASLEALKSSHFALAKALKKDSDKNTLKALSNLAKLESGIIRIHAFQASLTQKPEAK